MNGTKAIILGTVEDCTNREGLPFYLSSVAAGFPSAADDYMEKKLDLHSLLVKNEAATFFVRANGESMINAGIHDNDLLIVDRSISATHGKIVIAALDGDLTVKRLIRKEAGSYLMPENDAYPPIDITYAEHLHIWGVVTYVIHKV